MKTWKESLILLSLRWMQHKPQSTRVLLQLHFFVTSQPMAALQAFACHRLHVIGSFWFSDIDMYWSILGLNLPYVKYCKIDENKTYSKLVLLMSNDVQVGVLWCFVVSGSMHVQMFQGSLSPGTCSGRRTGAQHQISPIKPHQIGWLSQKMLLYFLNIC